MSLSTPETLSDPTFRSYSAAQAKAYAAGRSGGYASALYDFVVQQHQSSGGGTGRLLDVGCGTGKATRDLALCFDSAMGTDPGAEMINTAKEAGGKTASGQDVQYQVLAAEDIEKVDALEPGTVDLITAAMAVGLLNPCG
jgi:predicted TPR repeat methyltransferase